MSSYNLEAVRSIAWGINHEETAIESYRSLGCVVEDTGLWLHSSGVLGASPDGCITFPPIAVPPCIHYQNREAVSLLPSIIEVKCPYSARDMTVAAATSQLKEFYIGNDNGRLFLKESRNYYHQIQGQLHLTDTLCCDLIVWTSCDFQIIRVPRSITWTPNIARLVEFYFTMYLQMVLEK